MKLFRKATKRYEPKVESLSRLTIDADKDWNAKNLTNVGAISGCMGVSGYSGNSLAHQQTEIYRKFCEYCGSESTLDQSKCSHCGAAFTEKTKIRKLCQDGGGWK